jgi:hypothetical protein
LLIASAFVARETGPGGPPKPRLLDRVREAIRTRHYSRRTEKTYVAWIRRYILAQGPRQPRPDDPVDPWEFLLQHLAVEKQERASWLNQIEIYFSIVQRKVLTPNDFASLAEVAERLLRFQDHYERAAAPFQWTFTRQDLAALPAKLAAKDRLAAA